MKFLISLILNFCFFSGLALAKSEVDVRSTVEVGSALGFQLEDLTAFKNKSPETIRSLLDLPLPFKSTTITREEFLAWVKEARVQRPELREISFKVPEKIQVSSIAGLSRDQLKQRMLSRLLVKCPDCQFQILLSNVPTTKSPTANIEWKDIPLAGAFMVAVTTTEGQNLGWVSGQIKAQRFVIKTAHVLRAGDTLQESDLLSDLSDITFIKDYYLQKKELVGKKVSRVVSFGTLLSSSDIQRNYDVKQGQSVRAILGNENFEITLQAVAQESGVAGDLIRIRNTGNQKVISARVMEKGTVRIE